MENKNLELQKEEIATALETCAFLVESGGKLQSGLLKLQHLYEEIANHLEHGDLTDQAQNSKLWHDLNNIEHQLNQFGKYAASSVTEISESSGKIIETLRSLRPPKENT